MPCLYVLKSPGVVATWRGWNNDFLVVPECFGVGTGQGQVRLMSSLEVVRTQQGWDVCCGRWVTVHRDPGPGPVTAACTPALAGTCAPFTCLSASQLDCVDPRAVQLGALLVRGLTMVVLANSVCGCPLRVGDFMPWNVFDGKLFHEKYLQSEKGCAAEVLVEQNVSSQRRGFPPLGLKSGSKR